MSWVKESKLSWPQWLAAKVMTAGPLPRHVGFIMDGNRRYAAKRNMDKVRGHVEGFDRLSDVLNWCRELGIREVSVYAFSIENFKRSVDEVNALMKLACDKAELVIEERDKFAEVGLKIRFFGDFSLLTAEVREHLSRVMETTKRNSNFALNICFSYTGRNDILRGVNNVLRAVREEILEPSDVCSGVVDLSLDTCDSQPLDLVVRTSGEVRLSDFMLWQSDFAVIHFTRVLWPELSFWHILGAVLHFQVHLPFIQDLKQKHENGKDKLCRDVRKTQDFLQNVRLISVTEETKKIPNMGHRGGQLMDEISRFEAEISRSTNAFAGPPSTAFIPHQLQTSSEYHNHGWSTMYPSAHYHASGHFPEQISEPVERADSANATPTPAVIMAAPKRYGPVQPELPLVASTSSTSYYKPSSAVVPAAAPNPISKTLKQSTSDNGFFSVYQYNPDGSKRRMKKCIRTAGGQIWDDTSLNEWDPDDFRLFCGDLGNDVNDDVLMRTFSKYPSFTRAKVVKDKRTNKSKGYGFVSFKDPKDYAKAVREMNGKYVGSRPIKLKKSNWRDRNLDVVRKKKVERAAMGYKV
ncbi:unnamed protein product [Notodromas monacha]|uniref:RNA-binding protein 42 n=1 Tax=Notodromas monacha TaxID=399045 RepID=A0A7R9BIW6_9CRUS|nr:unnamed protein product [Notodromas monacha]CAG0916370.1 unnamed protein product [Notodromas monacha]